MVSNKTKIFHYKVARYNNDPEGFSLQELIEDAYAHTTTAFDCAYSFQQDGQNYHLLNYFSPNHSTDGIHAFMLGAEFLSYVKGNDLVLINTAKMARELPLEATNLSAQGREAIEGAIYFGVVDDDVVFTQSTALRVQALEKYLNWLIREKGDLWERENYVALSDPDVPRALTDAAKTAREIRIVTPVHFEPAPHTSKQEVRLKASGLGITALKALIGALPNKKALTDEFTVEELAMSRSLEVELQLRWKGRRENPKPYNLMEQVTRQLRHVNDELDYTIVTEDGTKISKQQVKRSQPHSVAWGGARPVFDDLFPKMLDWLKAVR